MMGSTADMIHQRYDDAFCTLTAEELACCTEGLRRTREVPDTISSGAMLLQFCRAAHVSQAEVVMGMARMHTPHAVTAVERIIMRPIDRRTASEVERERRAANPRAIAAPVSAREATTDTRVIRMLVEGNPKRPGTSAHERFAKYVDGMTVAEFLRAGGTRGDLSWDQERAFVRLEAEAVHVPVEPAEDTAVAQAA